MMKRMTKWVVMTVVFALIHALVPVAAFTGEINPVSREDGSGTRSAFVEICQIIDEHKDDMTRLDAVIMNSTNGVMQTVANDKQAIGYISLGSLNDTVRAVKIDGVEPTAETIKAGEYPIARAFNLAWSANDEMTEVAKDFLKFIHSQEGQEVVKKVGFIDVTPEGHQENEPLPHYEPSGVSGNVGIVGSTSVTPVMEQLSEAYHKLNPKAQVSITSNGSSAGMQAAKSGTADFGMASRDLTDAEKEGLTYDKIALDGIVVVVNKKNDTEHMTKDQVKEIFLGNINKWQELN